MQRHEVPFELYEGALNEVAALDRVTEERPPTARAFPVITAASLAEKAIPIREWLVDGLIPAKAPTILGGDGGTGKSLLALQLAVAATTGAYWIGYPVNEGTCLYVSAEDDIDELHRRLADIAASQNHQISDFRNLHLVPLAGEDALLAAVAVNKNVLQPTKLFTELERLIDHHRPVLLVLDTLADFFGGMENDRSQARQFVGMLRGLCQKYDVTVLLLNHPSLTGMASGSGSSGSTAWNNSVRSRLYLDRVKSDDGREEDADVRILRSMKSNYGRTGEEIKLRWQTGAFKRMGSSEDIFSGRAKQSKADRIFMQLLQSYRDQGRHVSPTPSSNYAPVIFARDPLSHGINKHGFTGAMNRLFAANIIAVQETGRASKRVKCIVPSSAARVPDADT